ncbi:MAG: GNAT family N-acetyltransferase [Dermatophilaceae bacterium]
MLRATAPVRALSPADRDEAIALCARNPAANVFVAARIEEGALYSMPGSVLGVHRDRELVGLAWASVNLVPAECDEESIEAVAQRVRRWRRQCASLFGPADQVGLLWERLSSHWGPARVIRHPQPLMSTRVPPSMLGVSVDPRLRPAQVDEVDIVLPAAAAMYTEEIGYPPYSGSAAGYRSGISSLIRAGHTYVWIEDRTTLFKADIGSVGAGAAQIQGVWLTPRLRGRGLARPLMAAVTEGVLRDIADEATLYVNDFNAPARATYAGLGFAQVGSFMTVLL